MKKNVILSEVYFARIKAVESLIRSGRPSKSNAPELRELGVELEDISALYGKASTGNIYASFGALLRIVALLVDWRTAVLDAAQEAERFLRGAKAQYRLWLTEYQSVESVKQLVAASQDIENITAIDSVGTICQKLAATPLPIGVFADEFPRISKPSNPEDEPEPPPELAVAFLKFLIDQTPASELHYLSPGEVHDLEIEVRVSRWPEAANQLRLAPVTIESSSTYELPTFLFEKPAGVAPHTLCQRGRAVLKAAQGLQARPFEFKYAAEFLPIGSEQPVAVVGHRTLLLESFDFKVSTMSGYSGIDKVILKIRNDLRRHPEINSSELSDLLAILTPLGSLAGRAVQDSIFKGLWSENQFQIEVRNELRRRPEIGSELDEHAHAAGGITDLSFHGIPIELKCESKVMISLADCSRFIEQTVSYIVAKGKRLGLLCVLDSSPKSKAPYPAEEGIELISRATDKGNILICVVLIQGNLPLPSAMSR